MKSINFLLIIAAFLFVCNTGFAQSSKATGKAVEKTNKLDEQIKSENPALALSEAQKEQIVALQVERMNAITAFKKSNSNKEEVKAKSKELNKAMSAKINDEILTAEQMKAQKTSRKKMKGKKDKGGKMKGKKGKGKKGGAKAGKASKKPAMTMAGAEVDKINATASAKQKARAEKATEKMNASIVASDANLALSADQRKQMNALSIKGSLEQKEMKEAGATEEEMKMKKKSNRKMINNILTKEQKAARKAAKKKK